MAVEAQVLPFVQPKKGLDLGAAIKASTKTEATPKKGKAPSITDAPPAVKEAIDQVIGALSRIKQDEGVVDVYKPTILDFFQTVQDREGYARRFATTFAILGNTTTAKVGNKNLYTMKPEDEAQLRAILGGNFDSMVIPKHTVSLKPEVLEDEALGQELMELIGEKFLDFFQTKTVFTVCENFNKLVYEVLKPEDLENLRVYAKQYAASVKL